MRAAVVGGGAYALGKRRAEGAEPEPEPEAAPAPPQEAAPAAGGVTDDSVKRLQDLGKLHDQGVLTDDEFAQEKAKVLGT